MVGRVGRNKWGSCFYSIIKGWISTMLSNRVGVRLRFEWLVVMGCEGFVTERWGV